MRPVLDPGHLFVVFLIPLALAAGHAAAYDTAVASSEGSELRECPVQWQGQVLAIRESCTWGSGAGVLPASTKLSILGSRPVLGMYSNNSATPCIYAAAGAPSKEEMGLGKTQASCSLLLLTNMQVLSCTVPSGCSMLLGQVPAC